MSDHSKFKIILAFAAIYLIWGSTYLAIRYSIETMPPFLMAGIRFLIAGLPLYFWMRIRGAEAPRPSQWLSAIMLGLLMVVGGNGLVTRAELTVPSGLTALLVAMAPMWIVLADWLRPRGSRPRLSVVLGLLLGFIGVALLVNPADIGGQGEIDLFGAVLIIAATISWAVGSIYSRHADQPQSRMLGTAMQMIAGGAAMILISVLSGESASFEFDAVTLKSWLSLGYLITAGSVAFVAYIWLLTASTPAKAATYAFVNPVIAQVLGNLIAGETLSSRTIQCAAIVIIAVMIIISAKARTARPFEIKTVPIGVDQPCTSK